MSESKKIIIIIVSSVVGLGIIIAGVGFFILSNSEPNDNGSNEVIPPANTASSNTNSIENVNNAPAIATNSEISVEGTVFIKGYSTPSESYGVLTTDGNEIGLGKYDSMKEQFRPYIGDKVAVTFSNVCRSTNADCCKTVCFYCGTVKSWEPLDE